MIPDTLTCFVKDLGLENGKEEKPEPLSQVQHHKYRSQVARCFFLSQDRADITFIVNELCQRMSNPTQQSLVKLKRLARYLKRERQWGQVFKYGKLLKRKQRLRTRTGQVARRLGSHQALVW